MTLDPDDPRPPYMQIANALRAAILTKQPAPGYQPPSGNELAKRYSVARMTVQQALRVLRDEGLIVTRQGSGVFVRGRSERPVGLRPHIERAFERPQVSIDFAGFSGETLHGVLQEPLDKIRVGRLTPEAISIRMLLVYTGPPWGVPLPRRRPGRRPGLPRARRHHHPAAHPGHQRLSPRASRPGPGAASLRGDPRPPPRPAVQALHPQQRGSVLRLLPRARAQGHPQRRSPTHLRPGGKTRCCSTTPSATTTARSGPSTSSWPAPGSTASGPPSPSSPHEGGTPGRAAHHHRPHPPPPARLRRANLQPLRRAPRTQCRGPTPRTPPAQTAPHSPTTWPARTTPLRCSGSPPASTCTPLPWSRLVCV